MVLYFDTETTGLRPGRICQLSYVMRTKESVQAKNMFFSVGYVEPSAAAVLTPPAIGVFTMVYSMIAVPIVSRFTRRPSEALVNSVFEAASLPVNEVKQAVTAPSESRSEN